jgi:hypothetical protein
MLSSVIVLLTLSFAAADPITSTKCCKDYKIPLNVSSLDYTWVLPPNENNYDVTTVTKNIARWDANVTLNPISGASPVTIQYEISGTFCSPQGGGDGAVLIATHGFGFDRRSVLPANSNRSNLMFELCSYWDPAIEPENYSFVDYVVAKGYSVFYYDRLGVSKSSQ